MCWSLFLLSPFIITSRFVSGLVWFGFKPNSLVLCISYYQQQWKVAWYSGGPGGQVWENHPRFPGHASMPCAEIYMDKSRAKVYCTVYCSFPSFSKHSVYLCIVCSGRRALTGKIKWSSLSFSMCPSLDLYCTKALKSPI